MGLFFGHDRRQPSSSILIIKHLISWLDSPPIDLYVFADETKIAIGDTDGKVYVLDSETAELLDSVKSMGEPVELLVVDDINNIIYSHGNQIAVVNESLEPTAQFKIDTELLGKMVFMRPMQNLIIIGTASSTFVLLDTFSGEVKSSFKPKGWSLSSEVRFLRSQIGSVANLGGTQAGQLFLFDIN